jgi:hypothetical protein
MTITPSTPDIATPARFSGVPARQAADAFGDNALRHIPQGVDRDTADEGTEHRCGYHRRGRFFSDIAGTAFLHCESGQRSDHGSPCVTWSGFRPGKHWQGRTFFQHTRIECLLKRQLSDRRPLCWKARPIAQTHRSGPLQQSGRKARHCYPLGILCPMSAQLWRAIKPGSDGARGVSPCRGMISNSCWKNWELGDCSTRTNPNPRKTANPFVKASQRSKEAFSYALASRVAKPSGIAL